jgi:predicted amidohydrolase YtcJ
MHADVVLTGGRVFAGLATDAPAEQAVAVRDGVIVAVGAPDDVAGLIAPGTEVVDTTGMLVVPGFHDAHVHPVQAGVELLQCDLTGTADAADCLRRVAAYAAAHPDEPWIVGAGWSMEFFPGDTPTAAALDAVVADRPVVLSNRDHHGAWGNSRALELAGITAATPDPAGGRIERDEHGAPTGTLHEGAVNLLDHVRPAISADLLRRGLLRAERELLALGITSWQDALIGSGLGMPDGYDTYLSTPLTARVVGALWWDRTAGLDQLPGLIARRDAVTADPARLRMDVVKIMVDGVAENFTAAISSPYLDGHGHPTDNSGISFFPPDDLATFVTAIDAAGFGIHFHALGDRAVTEALDAVAAARAANGRGASDGHSRRHQLAHLQLVGESDVPRFAALDAVANLQPLWACHEPQLDELTLPFLEPTLIPRHYPFGDLARAGARLAAGSDWPVSSADPLAGIRVAVTRVEAGSDAQPLGPEQALDLATTFAAYTSGGAWVNDRETTTGRIAEGFRADLAVIDGDPFAGPPEALDELHISSSWVDGVRVYDRQA